MRQRCPYLPNYQPGMSWRDLDRARGIHKEMYFVTTQSYAQYLWESGATARALLALLKAIYSEVPESCAINGPWPLPYRAFGWMIRHHPGDTFMGNPRISLQHQATRGIALREPLRCARAWAVWLIACKADPSLEPDRSDPVKELSETEIATLLQNHGLPGETDLWIAAIQSTKSGIGPAANVANPTTPVE